MKKQARKDDQVSMMGASGYTTFRALPTSAIILFTLALTLLFNVVWADDTKDMRGALIKVTNRLDGSAFGQLNPRVKSVNGNILAIDINASEFAQLTSVKGICATQLDHQNHTASQIDHSSTITKYAGARVIVGILDNTGSLNASGMAQLKKIESEANVGFISYLSDDPNSTVIIRNLKTGESNLVRALAYMQEYAKTVNRPLVIELLLDGEEMNNPLFVQVCQKMAETGIQFIGAQGFNSKIDAHVAPLQIAFTMFNEKTGQITDRSDFWAINEVRNQELMLLGSDQSTCLIHFQNESGFEKVFLSNSSADMVMVTTLGADGEVNYYHIKNKETAFIPRELLNGTPVLEDGLAGVYPFHSKKAIFNGAESDNQFVDLKVGEKVYEFGDESGMSVSLASMVSRSLAMTLDNLTERIHIQIKDANGTVVYMNKPDASVQRIQTKIDLSQGSKGIYYLDLTTASSQQSFALLMN